MLRPVVLQITTSLTLTFCSRVVYISSSFWKFNIALLSDADFKEVLTAFTNSQKQSIVSFDSLAEWWDNLKVGIRNKCVEFCKNKRSGTNSEGNTVTKRLIRLKNLFHLGDVSVASDITDTENALSSCKKRRALRYDLELNGSRRRKADSCCLSLREKMRREKFIRLSN